MSSRARLVLALMTAAGLLAAGCGSPSKTAATTSTTAVTAGSTTAATAGSTGGSSTVSTPGSSPQPSGSGKGSTVTIGTIATLSGPLAASPDPDIPVMQAWISNVNATGGIDGHTIRLIVKDDGSKAATAVSDLRQLEQDQVVAIVNEASLVDADWAPLAEKAGLPLIGGNALEVRYGTSPDVYPSGTSGFAAIYGQMALAKKNGGSVAIFPCTELPTCAASVGLYKAFAATLGLAVGLNQAISASSPDFTAACQALKASRAKSYVVIDTVPVEARVADACRQQGVTAKLIASSGTVGPQLLTVPGAEGLLATDVDFPFVADSTPATQEFHAVLRRYGAASLVEVPGTNVAWTAMELFGADLKALRDGPVSSQSLVGGLATLNNETLGGLAPPLNFVKGQIHLPDCWFVLGISDRKFVAPQGLTRSCAPPALINTVAKAFLAKAS